MKSEFLSLLFPDVLSLAEENLRAGPNRLDCVRATEQCLREPACSSKYRTLRQCVAGGKESNFSIVASLEAKDECRSAMDALKQSPLYNCRCKRGMKKEKNCLRIYWGIYQSLQGWCGLSPSHCEEFDVLLCVLWLFKGLPNNKQSTILGLCPGDVDNKSHQVPRGSLFGWDCCCCCPAAIVQGKWMYLHKAVSIFSVKRREEWGCLDQLHRLHPPTHTPTPTPSQPSTVPDPFKSPTERLEK